MGVIHGRRKVGGGEIFEVRLWERERVCASVKKNVTTFDLYRWLEGRPCPHPEIVFLLGRGTLWNTPFLLFLTYIYDMYTYPTSLLPPATLSSQTLPL